MSREELQKLTRTVSFGLFSTVTDITLYTFFLTISSFGKTPTSIGTYQAFREADELLSHFNGKTIARSLVQLKKSGLVSYKKSHIKPSLTVTPKGKSYLHRILPSYRNTRRWDGHIYLITYDVPESRKQDREQLRKFIRHLGAGMLQDSVWIMFTNPKAALQMFVETKGLKGVVIVSNMGQDATIGDEDLSTLINRVYGLDKLNKRYEEFIARSLSPKIPGLWAISAYLSILKDDPQLPFELLPKTWSGEKALTIYQKINPHSSTK